MMDATQGLRADWTHAHKSTRSDNSGPYCVEVAPAWYSSTRTAYGEEVRPRTSGGVEVTEALIERLAAQAERGYDLDSLRPRRRGRRPSMGFEADGVAVRNSRDKQGPVLFFTSEQWIDFINFIKES